MKQPWRLPRPPRIWSGFPNRRFQRRRQQNHRN